FSKGYFGFDILGAIPFHRPTKWVQYRKLTYYGAIFFLPHNTATNHLHVMRQKASSAGHIIEVVNKNWPPS
ncbi:hypothetical protein QU851_00940, partial [Escherichia coli]|nr:hypothetical protein [Escherichia coli]